MGPPVPADSAEAVPVAEPPDDAATVYCWPSVLTRDTLVPWGL